MREVFAVQKLLTFFQQKNIGVFQVSVCKILTKTLTNEVVSFEQPGPDILQCLDILKAHHGYHIMICLSKIDLEMSIISFLDT